MVLHCSTLKCWTWNGIPVAEVQGHWHDFWPAVHLIFVAFACQWETWEQAEFLWTHNLRNLHLVLLWTIQMSSFSGNFMEHVSVIQLLMLWFHPIRGVVIKQWAASVIYFVANFHHFVKKIIIEYFVTNSFFFLKPITEKKIKNLLEITTTDYNVMKVV